MDYEYFHLSVSNFGTQFQPWSWDLFVAFLDWASGLNAIFMTETRELNNGRLP